ncbi:MAG: hypothetical protein JSV93_00980, partial [Candidatus Omnitrophota bacterium]
MISINPKKLILAFLLLSLAATNTSYAELRTNLSADVVVGQSDFTTGTSETAANRQSEPQGCFSDGERLFISEWTNNRVLIYNSIPTTNNASADVVIGQANFTNSAANDSDGDGVTDSVAANTMNNPNWVVSDGTRLIVSEYSNNRVLIYNNIPTTNNASADVVIGQPDFISNGSNQGGNPDANTLAGPICPYYDGTRLFICDFNNHRVLIYNSIPTSNNASADVVIGQPDFTSNGINQGGGANNPAANTLYTPTSVFTHDNRLFISEWHNHRVLIYNTIPTTNNASADIVIGQANFASGDDNQGGSVGANTLNVAFGMCIIGPYLFITDRYNDRILVYNNIPTTNNASADIVIGQPDFTNAGPNQGSSIGANTLDDPINVFTDGRRLFVTDSGNSRILIYNIDHLSAINLGPQFEQGKAVLGKVFNDINSNGYQDEAEQGIEGVKIASDTGIYAITDSDGKYHFPYIETGQHLLKVDTSTLPEQSTLTTE